MYAPTTWSVRTYPTHAPPGFDDVISLGALCAEASAVEGLGFLNWLIRAYIFFVHLLSLNFHLLYSILPSVMFYSIFLLSYAIIRATRGQQVWTLSLADAAAMTGPTPGGRGPGEKHVAASGPVSGPAVQNATPTGYPHSHYPPQTPQV